MMILAESENITTAYFDWGMKMKRMVLVTAIALSLGAGSAFAQNFPFNSSVVLNVGDRIILKGVRGQCDDTRAPAWNRIKSRLPKSKTGSFSNGGSGIVNSSSCGKEVPARGIRFKAKKPGSETLTIFEDRISITVK